MFDPSPHVSFIPGHFTCTPSQHIFASVSYPTTPSQKKFWDAYEFLNEKLGREKEKKELFFCKLNIKDHNNVFTQIYIYIYIQIYIYIYIYIIYIYTYIYIIYIYIYIYIFIKNVKKCLHLFNKKTFLYAGLSSQQKNFKQLLHKLSERNLFAVWKIRQFFYTVNIEIGLTHTPPSPSPTTPPAICFCSPFKDSLPPQFSDDVLLKKLNKHIDVKRCTGRVGRSLW